jgi:predicted DNA-binding protein (MmcQ/YjbR family)
MNPTLDHKTLEDYILSLPFSWLDYPFGDDVGVYKVGGSPEDTGSGKMFALISEAKNPLQISLKCDPTLAKVLREKYEEVMEGHHLNKKHWITVVLTGQLNKDEIEDLIRHSYILAGGIYHEPTS